MFTDKQLLKKINTAYKKHKVLPSNNDLSNKGCYGKYSYLIYLNKKELINEYDEIIDYKNLLQLFFQEKPKKQKIKKAISFYSSWEWKKLRYDALMLYNRRCVCCGFTPKENSKNYLVVDHINPINKYPSLKLEISNLQVLCNDCNMGKSDRYKHKF